MNRDVIRILLEMEMDDDFMHYGLSDTGSDEDYEEYENSEMSDESEDTIENLDDDPDYEPTNTMNDQENNETQSGNLDNDPEFEAAIAMEDQENDGTQSETEDVPSSAGSVASEAAVQEPPTHAATTAATAAAAPSAAAPSADCKPIRASQSGLDDDGQNCTICFEPWTNSSEHRLVSLRCGHLFGRSCITRWLRGQNARCPQCNARARKAEIRNIYAKSLKVIDTSERDKALEELAKEVSARRSAEITAAQERIKHSLAVQECERLKRELMDAQKQLQEYRSSRRLRSSQAAANIKAGFSAVHSINMSKDGGCRIVDSCELLGMLLVTQPSPFPKFPGFGFRKISTLDMRPSEFVLVHQKLIRDMAFHVHDGLVLTASIDKSLKITNVLSNSVVQTYNVDSDVWSCIWDHDNPMYFYGGLKTGDAYVFDIRMTNRHVKILPQFGTKTPVVSLQYLRKSPQSSDCGPVVAKLQDCALNQKIDSDYKCVPMPALGPYTCLSSDVNGHLLVSCRPSPKQPRVTHTVCDFIRAPNGELACYPVRTVEGGRTQLQLTRSKIMSHPDKESSVLICAGDEDSNGALIWDGSSGEHLLKLKSESPILDICGLKLNHKSFMTTLTAKDLIVYEWKSSI